MESITYRDGHAVDLEQLTALFRSAGWERRIEDRARLAQLVDGSMFVVTAWASQPNGIEQLVGFARAISDGVFNAYISTVAVLPSFRRQGIGRELVRRLLDGRNGIRFVLHAEPHVQPFWFKLGFELAPDMLRFRP
jgi:ribosomal protein S18 acetylase RimI-like enzyme